MQSTHDVLTRFEVPTDLVEDLNVPALTGLQRQGDVIIIPGRRGKDIGEPIPAEGVAVVRGEAGGNTHLLVAVEGDVRWRATAGTDIAEQGVATVPEGGQAGLVHPEHGLTLMGPGVYRFRRQTEQSDEIRVVQD
jgi:hypothetical protein